MHPHIVVLRNEIVAISETYGVIVPLHVGGLELIVGGNNEGLFRRAERANQTAPPSTASGTSGKHSQHPENETLALFSTCF